MTWTKGMKTTSMSKLSTRCIQMHRKPGQIISTISTVSAKSVRWEAAMWIWPLLVHVDEGGHSLIALVACTQLPVGVRSPRVNKSLICKSQCVCVSTCNLWREDRSGLIESPYLLAYLSSMIHLLRSWMFTITRGNWDKSE